MRYRGKYEAVPVRRGLKKASIHLQMLVTSAVSFVLCCSMLLGTTMAWFTDTITSSANVITIGELKVDVLYNGYSLRSTDTPVFGGASDTFVWSPGAHQIKELIVENQGNLDLNYALTFLSQNQDQAAFQYFQVYVKEEKDLTAATRIITEEADGWKYIGTLSEILNNEAISVFSGRLDSGRDGNKTHQIYSVALYMPSDVSDSSIQGTNLTLNIRLHAHQIMAIPEETVPPATETVTPSTETEAPADDGETE